MKVIKAFSHSASGELISSWAYGKSEKTYRPDKWNYPPQWLARQGYGILCFESIESLASARDMILKFSGSVWICEARTRWPMRRYGDSIELSRGRVHLCGMSWPRDTIMVAGIKPVSKLFDCGYHVGSEARMHNADI